MTTQQSIKESSGFDHMIDFSLSYVFFSLFFGNTSASSLETRENNDLISTRLYCLVPLAGVLHSSCRPWVGSEMFWGFFGGSNKRQAYFRQMFCKIKQIKGALTGCLSISWKVKWHCFVLGEKIISFARHPPNPLHKRICQETICYVPQGWFF